MVFKCKNSRCKAEDSIYFIPQQDLDTEKITEGIIIANVQCYQCNSPITVRFLAEDLKEKQ